MTPAARPDLDIGRRFLALHPPPGRLLCCAVTGSHLYGFPSPDSDLDLKGIHAAPAEALLGLDPPAAAHDLTADLEGVECDVTTQEVARALELVLRGNGNMLERLFSRFQLVDTPELHALRRLATDALSRRVHTHYAGYFRGRCHEHERLAAEGKPQAKTLLYAYRAALTGVHLLRTGEVEPDLTILAPQLGFPGALALVDGKRRLGEHAVVTPAEDAEHRTAWPALAALLEEALAATHLPAEPPNRAACSEWLVALRTAELVAAARDVTFERRPPSAA